MPILGVFGVLIGALPLWYWLALKTGAVDFFQRPSVISIDLGVFAGLAAVAVFTLKSKAEKAFVLSAFVSLLVSYGKDWIMGAVLQFFALVIGLIFAQRVAVWARSEKAECRLLDLVALIALMNAAWVYVQLAGADFIFSPVKGSIVKGEVFTGFLGNPNLLGALMAVSLPVFFCRRRFGGITWVAVALWLSGSAFAMLAALCGSIFYLWQRFGRRIGFAAIIASMTIVIAFSLYTGKPRQANDLRWRALKRATAIALERPVLGWGNGSFADVFAKKAPEIYDPPRRLEHLHNEYGQVLFEQGLFGLAALAAMLILLGRKMASMTLGHGLMASAGIAALAINALGLFVMRVPLIAFVGLIYYGIIKGGIDGTSSLAQSY